MMLSRREAIELLGTGTGGGLAALHGLGLGAQTPGFSRGAIIRTLLKDVPPDAVIGSTLFHEHLSIRYPLTKALAEAQGRPVPASFTDDVDLVVEETKAAAKDGVGCIVDGGHPDMDRDLAALRWIASESGVHIVGSCLADTTAAIPKQLAKRGVFVGFDRVTIPIVPDGYADQLLLSSDFSNGRAFKKNGGPGVAQTATVFGPMLLKAGVSEATLRRILVDNPRRFLAFVPKGA